MPHIFTYANDFALLAGIIPLSLRNWGAFDTVWPPCLQVGATDPSAPRLLRLCSIYTVSHKNTTICFFTKTI